MIALGISSLAQVHAGGHDKGGRYSDHPSIVHHASSGKSMEKMFEKRAERLAKRVDATPEQRQKLLSIASNASTQVQSLMAQREDWHMQEIALLRASTFDRSAFVRLQQKRNAHRQSVARVFEATQLDSLEVLNEEQREELAEYMEDKYDRKKSKYHRQHEYDDK
jgi:Spy/CpxP family protein refolding chaperone